MAKPSERPLSRRDARNLDIEIGFLEGLVRRDPQFVDALELLGDDYTSRGRFQEGLRIDRRLKNLRPDDPDVRYNLACSLALTRRYADAIAELGAALDLGFSDWRHLARDPDLAAVRRRPEYAGIRERLRRLRADAAGRDGNPGRSTG